MVLRPGNHNRHSVQVPTPEAVDGRSAEAGDIFIQRGHPIFYYLASRHRQKGNVYELVVTMNGSETRPLRVEDRLEVFDNDRSPRILGYRR